MIDFIYKEGRVNFQSYNNWNATVAHLWSLGGNQFLSSELSYGYRGYKGSDSFVTGNGDRDRDERPLRFRTTYTMPVARVIDFGDISKSSLFNNFNLSVTGEYTYQNSNISNYDYDNLRGQVLLTKRYEF